MKFTPKTHQLRGYSDNEYDWGILTDDMGGSHPFLIRVKRADNDLWTSYRVTLDGLLYSERNQTEWDLVPRVTPHNIPDNLPEAIRCVAMDEDGAVYGYSCEKSHRGGSSWLGCNARKSFMHIPQWAYGPILDGWDWKESLHKRNDEGKWDRGYFKWVGEG